MIKKKHKIPTYSLFQNLNGNDSHQCLSLQMEQGKWRFIVISLLLSDTQKNITYQEMTNNSILGG